MILQELLEVLEYAGSPHYVPTDTEDQHSPELSLLLRTAEHAGVSGIYLFQASSEDRILHAQPAVFVASASTPQAARDIHRRLWNLGRAPFLIVLLPDQVRIYTGFNYSHRSSDEGLIGQPISLVRAVLREHLKGFVADAIDSGSLWQEYAGVLSTARRVDTRLLGDLGALSAVLREQRHIDSKVAHALIGKYVYIRYLRDRNILSDEWLSEHGLNVDDVLGRQATVEDLRTLVEALENRFNGSVFPLDFDASLTLSDEDVSLVASVFRGDHIVTHNVFQRSLDFDAYDFQYIPVELLSSIYEQFLTDEDAARRSQIGAVYTPELLADYLIAEIDSVHPLLPGMRVLDPACGSGIFLVLAYRRLVERERARRQGNEKDLSPNELVVLLDGLYGIEREQDACYVTEFSLLLTLLNYVKPPALHANRDFRFPTLHNTRIFQCDFFDDTSPFWQQERETGFDWVIGNPPWVELKPDTTGEDFARTWMNNHRTDQPVGGNRVSEAFSWRVGSLLQPNGYAGLILHAKSLFNHKSRDYRRQFFHQHEVARITNFANLRRTLFGRRAFGKPAIAPAITITYGKASRRRKRSIVHYGPFAINQAPYNPGQLWAVTVNGSETRSVSAREAEQGDMLVWKMALWGTYRDKQALQLLRKLFPITLEQLCKERNWNPPIEGVQLRTREDRRSGVVQYIPALEGRYALSANKLNRSGRQFSIPEDALDIILPESCYVRVRGGMRGLLGSKAPHVLISATGGSYAIYSDQFFVVPPRQIGLSCCQKGASYAPDEGVFRAEDAHLLRALSVFLSSSLAQYYLFFQVPDWGIERDRITLDSVKHLPIPRLTSDQVDQLATLQKELARDEREARQAILTGQPRDLDVERDERIATILGIPDDISLLASEFIRRRLALISGGFSERSLSSSQERSVLAAYAEQLVNELDDFTVASGAHHRVIVTPATEFVACTVQITDSESRIPVQIEDANEIQSQLIRELRQILRQRFSQWVYTQRELRILDEDRIHIFKPRSAIDWTRTQALNDADDIIAEVLSAKK